MGLLDQAQQPQAQQAQPPQPQQAQPEQMPPEQAPQEQEQPATPENDQALQQAKEFVGAVLYSNKGADQVAKLAEADAPMDMLANLAYELASKADEKTDGNVADEDLVELAMFAMTEIGEVAEAAGATLKPSDIAQALNTMMVRFLKENGVPEEQVAELQKAMSAVPEDEFNELANREHGGEQ